MNMPPMLNPLNDQTVNWGETASFPVTGSDPDPGDTITFTKTSGPGTLNAQQEFSWETTQQDVGPTAVQFKVTDSHGAYDTGGCTITVVNTSPMLDPLNDHTVSWGQTVTFPLSAVDPDQVNGDTLTFSKVSGPGNLNGTTFTWTTNKDDVNSHAVQFKVTDSIGAFDTGGCTITVVNNPPMINPLGDVTISWGQTVNFNVIASDPDPGDQATVTHIGGPGTFTNGTFSWTPTVGNMNDLGSKTVLFKATDIPGLTATEGCTITVVNNPPMLNPLNDVTVFEGDVVNFAVLATDLDQANGDVVTITQTSGVGTLTGGNFTWTANQVGSHSVKFKAVDRGNLSDVGSCTITVEEWVTP